MSRIRLTQNLWLDEYIPNELYNQYQDRPHILIGLLDERLIRADQLLRDRFGPVTINNWWHGGERNWSGIRLQGSPFYSFTSQHSFGRASDKLFWNVTAEEVRSYIKIAWAELGITCIEDNVSWIHTDVRWNQNNNLLIVQP